MKNVLLIGDLIRDKFIFGDSIRLNPESPMPLITQKNVIEKAGGAGNVANNLKGLDFNVHFIHCEKTSIKTRIISNGTLICRLDEDVIESNNHVIEKVNQINYNNYDAIVISDYNKGTIDNVETFLPKMLNSGLKIFVDPKRKIEAFKNVFCIKCNELEFTTYFEKLTESNILKAASECNVKLFIVTLGKNGVYYCYDKKVYHLPAYTDNVADVTGAGDCFISALVYAIENEIGIHEAIKMANRAAGISVQTIGTYTLKKEDLIEKKVFTNGCFDILHRGHIELLEKSKQMGDYLIVGLNSDASVKRLKGNSRPINNQEDRKKALESLKFVDEVIIFDEDTPYELIQKIKPDIITKGGDYVAEKVIGNDLAIVKIIPLVEGYSTTKIVGDLCD